MQVHKLHDSSLTPQRFTLPIYTPQVGDGYVFLNHPRLIGTNVILALATNKRQNIKYIFKHSYSQTIFKIKHSFH